MDTFKVTPGCDISELVCAVSDYARRTNRYTRFTHNGRTVTARPGDSAALLFSRWETAPATALAVASWLNSNKERVAIVGKEPNLRFDECVFINEYGAVLIKLKASDAA